ncbi:retrotransposon protein, putative, ty1-copia subclass [Tanacetum coccineum]|uniref:Retrotransposon protein, putative, ty1-copia subclass n=1 Tax=Tanacetum coccineum TaxID=301880 RepID=A0ABQ4WQK6_9ASTR
MEKKENPAKTEDDENTGKKESIFWTPQMDDAYIKAMLKEQDKAEDEVWKDLIEANPDALEWKTKTISNYDELYMLFAKDRETGVVAETAKESRKRMMNNKDIVEIDDDTDEFQSTVNKIGDDIQVTTTPQCSQMKPKKKKKVKEESDIVSKIQSSINHVADAMKECTKAIVGSRPHVYYGGEIYSQLEFMGVDQDLKVNAFIFLLRSPESTRALLDCPLDMRKYILNEMMGIGLMKVVGIEGHHLTLGYRRKQGRSVGLILQEATSRKCVVVFIDIRNGRGCFDDDIGCCLGDAGLGVKGGIIRLFFRDGGLPILIMAKTAKKENPAKTEDDENTGKKESIFWTPQMDDAYIKAMLKEQDKVEFNQKQFIESYKNHKKKFSSCYDVFRGKSLSGFSWNPVSELIEAEDEVWKDLIEANPDALEWKTKTTSNYNELYMLFAKDRATGVVAETAKERRKRMMNNEDIVEIDDDTDEFHSTNNKIGDDIQVTTTPQCSQMKPKKKKKVEEESDIASKIQSSIEHVADAMKECTKAILLCLMKVGGIEGDHLTLGYRRQQGRSVGGYLGVGLDDGCSNVDGRTSVLLVMRRGCINDDLGCCLGDVGVGVKDQATIPRTAILLCQFHLRTTNPPPPPPLADLHKQQLWGQCTEEIVGLMLMTMDPYIQNNLEHLLPKDMLQRTKKRVMDNRHISEHLQTCAKFHACKPRRRAVCIALTSKNDRAEYRQLWSVLAIDMTQNLSVSLILVSLRKEYDGFVQNYYMHGMRKIVNELHAMLKLHEQTLPPKEVAPTLHAIRLHYALSRLGHINKKHIEKLQHDRLLDSTDIKSFEKCVACMSVFVAWNAEFFENEVIDHEASESLEDLEIIQEKDTHPSLDTSLDHEEDDKEIDEPQRDLGEPANYKAALLDPESNKWLNAMNVEMQSMKDNEVWELVELPPVAKTIGHKWLFKKKTNMDGAVHTYKARLVAKGFTQTPGIDYEEIFFPVADIKAIRILIAIAAFYDYEIWQMDVKTAFLNGYLNKEVYMEQPEGFLSQKYPNRVCKLKRSIYGLKQASRQWNKRFDDEIKKFGLNQNRDEPCVYVKASGNYVTFLILYVDET